MSASALRELTPSQLKRELETRLHESISAIVEGKSREAQEILKLVEIKEHATIAESSKAILDLVEFINEYTQESCDPLHAGFYRICFLHLIELIERFLAHTKLILPDQDQLVAPSDSDVDGDGADENNIEPEESTEMTFEKALKILKTKLNNPLMKRSELKSFLNYFPIDTTRTRTRGSHMHFYIDDDRFFSTTGFKRTRPIYLVAHIENMELNTRENPALREKVLGSLFKALHALYSKYF